MPYTVPPSFANPAPAAGTTYSAGQGAYPHAAAPVAQPAENPAASQQYGQWARSQRPQGTVYGAGARAAAMASPLENSGSLTGHILSQGHPEESGPRNRTARVVVILTVTLLVVVIGGLLAAIFFRDTITQLFSGLLGG
jgi:hypothetical protein